MIHFTKRRYESNKPHLDYNYYSPTFLYGIKTTPQFPAICLEVGDFSPQN